MKENLLKDEVDGPAYAFRAKRNTSSEKKHALTGLLFSYFAHGLPYACSWAICVIDMVIAALYNLDIYLEPTNEYTNYMMTEIWIRPTITYGLVACFVTERGT